MGLRRFGLAAILLGLVAGCSHGPVPPAKDPTKGEFYKPEEVLRLPADERERYCSYLETTLRGLRAESAELRLRLDTLNVQADSVRARSVRLNKETADLTGAVRDLRLKDKAIHSYVVKAGDNLRTIAATVLGDALRWKEIYEANKKEIGAENAQLKPGTRLTIPPRAPVPGDPQAH